jgi:hypothetical protein
MSGVAKEGAARKGERPKSREETPKVGYDTLAKPNVPYRAYGLVRGAVQLRPSGPGCIYAHMLPNSTGVCINPRPAGNGYPISYETRSSDLPCGPGSTGGCAP